MNAPATVVRVAVRVTGVVQGAGFRPFVHAAAALPLFIVGHATVMIFMASAEPPPLLDLSLHGLVLAMAIAFWLPVLGVRRRLSDPGRSAYLFLTTPTLDLAGVWIIIRGDSPGGLAMITGMFPIGLSAIVVTWRWISPEQAPRRPIRRRHPPAERPGTCSPRAPSLSTGCAQVRGATAIGWVPPGQAV